MTCGDSAVSLREAAVQINGRALRSDISLDVAPGEFVAILGPNSAGKSTLLKVVLGLLPLSRGVAHVHGQEPGRLDLPDHGHMRGVITLVMEDPLRMADDLGRGYLFTLARWN